MANRTIKLRGGGIPAGYIVGRSGNNNVVGAAGLVKIADLATKSYVLQVAGVPPIADGDIIANISGGSAVPIGNTLTQVIDYTLAAGSPVQGQILYRDVATWKSVSLTQVIDNTLAAGSPVQGQILYRGTTGWVVLAPGTSGYILQTNGSGQNPTWVTGPVGSTGNTYCNVNSFGGWVASTTAFATKGLGIQLNVTITIDQITAGVVATSGHVYQAGVYPVNASLVIQSGQQSVQVTAASTATQDLVFTFGAPITLTAGQLYIIAVTDTSAANGTTPINLLAGQSAHQPLWYNLPVTVSASFNATRYTLASLAPTVGNTFIIGSGLSHALALRAQV